MLWESCWSSSHKITVFKSAVSCSFKHGIFEIMVSSHIGIFSICKSIEINNSIPMIKTNTSRNNFFIKFRNKDVSTLLFFKDLEESVILRFSNGREAFPVRSYLPFFEEGIVIIMISESDFYSFFYSFFDSIGATIIHFF